MGVGYLARGGWGGAGVGTSPEPRFAADGFWRGPNAGSLALGSHDSDTQLLSGALIGPVSKQPAKTGS